ncbi:MAG: hypothetical protein ACYTKD_22310 [Planctomycetota bacterium]
MRFERLGRWVAVAGAALLALPAAAQEGGGVYVFQGGSLHRFDAETLELAATAELAPQRGAAPAA